MKNRSSVTLEDLKDLIEEEIDEDTLFELID